MKKKNNNNKKKQKNNVGTPVYMSVPEASEYSGFSLQYIDLQIDIGGIDGYVLQDDLDRMIRYFEGCVNGRP